MDLEREENDKEANTNGEENQNGEEREEESIDGDESTPKKVGV